MRRRLLPLASLVMCSAVTIAACDGDATHVESPPQPTGTPTATPTVTAVATTTPKASTYPEAAKRPVVTEYHGVKVTDDYQWMEKADDPEVVKWTDEENKRTRAYFDAVPFRKGIKDKIAGIIGALTPDRFALSWRGGQLFALKFQPPKQQEFLVVLKSPDDLKSERVLVDPNEIDKSGKTTIDYYVASPDGKKVAVSMSVGGTENGTIHVFDVATGKETGDVVTFANSGTAGGGLTWTKDGKGFYYTRHPHDGERPAEDMGFYQQVYFHKLGTKEADDKYAIGKEFPRIAETELATSEDGKWVLASVQNGDGGEYWHYLMDNKGKWSRFADLPDRIVHARFGADNKLYLHSTKDAPHGKILRVDPAKPDLAKAEVLVPQSDVSIRGYTVTKSMLYVVDLVGGPSEVRAFDLKGKDQGKLPLAPISNVGQILSLGGDDVLFRHQSYTQSAAWYTYKTKSKKVEKTAMATVSPVNLDQIEVVREMCKSKDGTFVPINILRKKGLVLDGSNPAILTGYGGYGISLQPGLNPVASIFLERGGVWAIANLRGGGEFGESWHLAGNLTKKQNVFDDFYACAKHLVDTKHTKSDKLGIIGGSNGGLLMGAALTQHPEMYKAVVSAVGIYDSIRSEVTKNGTFNVTEFGTVKDKDQFTALLAYSPLHNVKDNTAYPSVFMTSGANDPRVDAWHSRKMVARLQAATTGGPVLLRANADSGHGGGTPLDQAIDEQADIYTFFFKELGVEFK